MDVFPDLIGEAEFMFFNDATYSALEGVMDDLVASYLDTYCKDPNANPDIVNSIQEHLGTQIKSLIFHLVLKDKGIVDLITHLSPETVLQLESDDLNNIYDKLKYLNDNINYLMPSIPGRTKEAWSTFYDEFCHVLMRQRSAGVSPTYPNIKERLEANKFVFYVPNSKGHSTYTGIVNSKRRQWTMCLHGIEYDRYCAEHNIQENQRRAF